MTIGFIGGYYSQPSALYATDNAIHADTGQKEDIRVVYT